MASDTHGLLTEQLRIVDRARPEMERLARELSAQCIASSRVADELIFVATAGEPSGHAATVPVGQRIAFKPPLGVIFAAWLPPAQIDRWIGSGADAESRPAYHAALAVVRERGFAVGLPAQKAHRTFLARIRSHADVPQIGLGSFEEFVRDLEFDPLEMAAEPGEEPMTISAPIFGADGQVLVSLTILGLPTSTNAQGNQFAIARLLEAADHITVALGGHQPSFRQG